MLRMMREWLRYLKWILVLVIFSFLSWGATTWIGDGRDPGAQSNWAAEVNGETIAATTFRARAREMDNEAQANLGDQYAQMRSYLRIGQRAVGVLIDDELLYQEATRQGLRVSPQEVARVITRHPQFQENGRFIGLRRYRDLFRGGRSSIEPFEAGIQRRLMIAKCSSLITDGARVTDAEVEAEFLRRNETTTVDYLVIDPEELLAGDLPDDQAIESFFQQHIDRYMRGEGRAGLYVLFNAREFGAAAEISDAQVEAAYERDKVSRYIVPDQRRASHILFRLAPDAPEEESASTEKKARGVLEQVRSEGDFAELAREHSDDTSASNGGDLNFFGRGQMVPEFEEAAFALAAGEVSDLVRTRFGFHIIKVTEVREARTVPLEEVRETIREALSLIRGREEASQRAATVARASTGGTLEAVAQSQGALLNDTGDVHPGEALPAVQSSHAAVSTMMTMGPGEVSDPIAVPAGLIVVQVTAVVEDTPRPLEEVRDRVRKDILKDRARQRIEERIEEARTRGEGLERVARSLDLELKTAENLSRGGQLAGISRTPEVSRQIGRLEPETIGTPLGTPSGLVVLSVRERLEHRDRFDSQRDAIRNALLSQHQERLLRAFLRQLRNSGRVLINEPLVQTLDRG
jgi:peptidyl-prolyl cis-trans isomerase D